MARTVDGTTCSQVRFQPLVDPLFRRRRYGVARTMREATDLPYFAERGLIKRLPDPIEGELKVVGSPFHFSNADTGPYLAAPLAGEHSHSILSSLGYAEDEIIRLLECGVVVQQG